MSFSYLMFKVVAAVVTITLHEFIKAFISSSLGDPLPKRDGRVTINPIKHIEPIGFIVMVALGFGWGKPVETASIYYKDRRKGTLITYIAPSVVNFIFGVIMILVIAIIKPAPSIVLLLEIIAMFNIRHALFNIIPVYPLDGAKVLAALRNPNNVITMVNNQTFYQMILILFILWGIVSMIIDPVYYGISFSLINLYR